MRLVEDTKFAKWADGCLKKEVPTLRQLKPLIGIRRLGLANSKPIVEAELRRLSILATACLP